MINNTHVMIEIANDISMNEFQDFLTDLHKFITDSKHRHITHDLKVAPGYMSVPVCSYKLHLFELGKAVSQVSFAIPETPGFQAGLRRRVYEKGRRGLM